MGRCRNGDAAGAAHRLEDKGWHFQAFFGTAWALCGFGVVGTVFLWRSFQRELVPWRWWLHDRLDEDRPIGLHVEDGDFDKLDEAARRIGLRVEHHAGVNYSALLGLLVLIFAQSSWLDDWRWPSWWRAVVGLQMVALVVQPLLLWSVAARIKRLLQAHLDRSKLRVHSLPVPNSQPQESPGAGLEGTPPTGSPAERVERLLKSLTHGCFAPLERQPVLGALVVVIGSSGFVALLQLFQQFSAHYR